MKEEDNIYNSGGGAVAARAKKNGNNIVIISPLLMVLCVIPYIIGFLGIVQRIDRAHSKLHKRLLFHLCFGRLKTVKVEKQAAFQRRGQRRVHRQLM